MKILYKVCQNMTLLFSNVMGLVREVQFLDNQVTRIVTNLTRMPQVDL